MGFENWSRKKDKRDLEQIIRDKLPFDHQKYFERINRKRQLIAQRESSENIDEIERLNSENDGHNQDTEDDVFEYTPQSPRYVNIDENTVFKTRILRKSDKNEHWKAEAIVVRGGIQIARVVYDPIYRNYEHFGHFMSSTMLPSKGFDSDLSIIKTNFSYGACDVPEGDSVFTWNGKTLDFALSPEVINGADLAVSTRYSYILPSDPEGKPNCFGVKWIESQAGQTADGENDWSKAKETISYSVYKLMNGKLISASEKSQPNLDACH